MKSFISDSAISISDLDDPCLLKLLKFFDPASLNNIGLTSKRFRRIWQDHSLPNIWESLHSFDFWETSADPFALPKIRLYSTLSRFDQDYYLGFLSLNLRNITEQDLMVLLGRRLARGPLQKKNRSLLPKRWPSIENKKTLLVSVSKTNPNSLNVQHEAFVCWC